MKKVIIYIDGACSGNPGPGGWAAIMMYGTVTKEISGGEKDTTNNRMELLAAIKALEKLKTKCDVDMYTDSEYVKKGVTEWIHKWRMNNWKNAKNKEVKNLDLWHILDEVMNKHHIKWHWVKAHSGVKHNEMVDKLAVAAYAKYK